MFDLFFNLCRVEILEFKKNKIKYILYYLLLTLATVFTPRGIMKNLEIIILQQVYQELAWEPSVAQGTHSYSRRLLALGRK